MATSTIRYGMGVTQEVGMDFQNMGAKKVCLMTDKTVGKLPPMQIVLEAMTKAGINFEVYDNIRVEPTDSSFNAAIDFAKKGNFDAYLAVGGGSVMDTCKAANLFAAHPDAELLDFVYPHIGKGLPVTNQLKPLIAVPTTSGTGSETTGVAVFDYEPMKAKIEYVTQHYHAFLALLFLSVRLGPQCSMVKGVKFAISDRLFHALESYTAIPYQERRPRPQNPIQRPAYQGSNPISDVWSLHALRIINKFMKRAVRNADDTEARSNMHLASTFAGIGFGNAGVHLCHGMSYPISGLVKKFKSKDYSDDHPLVPHGLSVVVSAPAVFQFTAPMCPERHLEAAEILGSHDIRNAKREDAGPILADVLRKFVKDLDVDDGLQALGYSTEDIPALVKGTLPQHRVTKLSPRPQTEEDLAGLFEASMKIY
uniref:Hydroxyacid-oxoacid transhydrogenase, mitochondrial n=1 Tax=Branchiostoma floridae TaxID=7739 RepID=C3YKQ6_BRAFL|eukprot:XP_002603113.1 hypothetical protein BRAFLDRAFT_274863 [Branchiostoma floridae]